MEVLSMTDDPIVEEIRRHRAQHAARFGHDLSRIVEDLRKKERRSAHPLLSPGPRRLGQAAGDRGNGPALAGNDLGADVPHNPGGRDARG